MFQDRLQARLGPALQQAFQELFGHALDLAAISFQGTRPEFEGDLTINVFPFLKISGKGPEPTATAIGEHLQEHVDVVERFNVVKGFLNVVIADRYWLEFLQEIQGKELLRFPSTGKKVMVEYASPNTNKPLHLGHMRNIFLGHSVSRILETAGNEVVKVQVINDRGIHICKSMLAWQNSAVQRNGEGETPLSSGLKGDKLVGKYYVMFDREYKREIEQLVEGGKTREEAEKQAPSLLEAQEMLRKWEANDPEVRSLWSTMNGWVYEGFNATYARMGVDFDKLYYESETYVLGKQDVMDGLKKGVFYEKDGAIWVDNSPEGLDEKVLLRADGTSVYMTQDIGTAIKRFEEYPGLSKLIYTVGNEQDYHFKVLFIILKKLGMPWADELHHLSYGMVDLPSGKMKSREGTVVDADELLQEVVDTARAVTTELGKLDDFNDEERTALFELLGIAAVKYYLLKVDPKKRMLFDPAASIDMHGHTGPFIQYTYARIRSLERKAHGIGTWSAEGSGGSQLLPEERQLIKLLHHFPVLFQQAAADLDPASVANHVYELVKAYNGFYQNIPVLKEEVEDLRAMRLALSTAVADVSKKAMWCLGIEVPEKM